MQRVKDGDGELLSRQRFWCAEHITDRRRDRQPASLAAEDELHRRDVLVKELPSSRRLWVVRYRSNSAGARVVADLVLHHVHQLMACADRIHGKNPAGHSSTSGAVDDDGPRNQEPVEPPCVLQFCTTGNTQSINVGPNARQMARRGSSTYDYEAFRA